ncbi:MAG: hypothetical protein K0R27_203 [Xanthobacteraceae bacterium]|jgi:hypothetical protein|nr:hypothetical protein [Xanthobacteraceae bacterium]
MEAIGIDAALVVRCVTYGRATFTAPSHIEVTSNMLWI